MKKLSPLSRLIAGLWIAAPVLFLAVGLWVQATGNYLTDLQSGILMLVCFTLIIAAMTIQTVKNRKKHPAWAFYLKAAFLGIYYLCGVYTMLLQRL